MPSGVWVALARQSCRLLAAHWLDPDAPAL